MAKQKFRCKGVVRKTGQRVAVEVSAETKEAAVQIADKHGVTVEEIAPAKSQSQSQNAPRPKPAVARADDLLDPIGRGFGLADELTVAQPAGEPVLAPALGGRRSRPKNHRPWYILGGAAAVVLLVLIVALTLWPSDPTTAPVVASRPTPLPEKKQETPKPETKPILKPSDKELAYAARLMPMLAACEKMIRLLQGPMAPEQCAKQTNAIRDIWNKMPSPPSAAAWTAKAAAAARQLIDEAETATTAMRSQPEALGLIGGMSGDSPEVKEAARKAVAKMRTLVARIRGLIPPDCLPKK